MKTVCFAFGLCNKPQICFSRFPKRTIGNVFFSFVKPPKRCVYHLFFYKAKCPLFRHPFDCNQHSVSIESSFTNKATTILCFFPPVISVRFAPNHHSTNKATHFFDSFSSASAFDFHRTIILRAKQHIPLVSPVHNQRSISIEPSFYEQNNTSLCFCCP